MQEELKALGLSYNEQIVYISLLKLGETPVGNIIQDLKRIHRQSVYNALEALEERGMVTKKNKNGVHHFQVADPEIIIDNIKKQEFIAKRLSENIQKEMKKSRREQEVNIYDGITRIRQFNLLKYKSTPTNSIVNTIYATGKQYEETLSLNYLKKFDKIRNKKNILTKHITSEALRKDLAKTVNKLHTPSRETRYLPHNIITPVTIVIWHDSVTFQIFGDFPFVVDIVNEQMQNTFTKHFEALWKIAKK